MIKFRKFIIIKFCPLVSQSMIRTGCRLLLVLFLAAGGYAHAESKSISALESYPNVWMYFSFDDTLEPRLPSGFADQVAFSGLGGSAPVFTDGIAGKGLRMSSSRNNTLSIPRLRKAPFHRSNRFPSKHGALVLWIKPDLPLDKKRTIPLFCCQPSSLGLNIQGYRLIFYNTSNPQYALIGDLQKTLKDRWENTWHCIVVSWTNGEQKLYLDGQQMALRDNVEPIDFSKYTKPLIYIGSMANPLFPSFDGVIDELVLFKSPLTDKQIRTIYATKQGVLTALNVVLYDSSRSDYYSGQEVEIAVEPFVKGDTINICAVSITDGKSTTLSSAPCVKGTLAFNTATLAVGAYSLQIAVCEKGKVKTVNAPMPINIYKEHMKFIQITDPHYKAQANHTQLIKDAAEKIQKEYPDCDFVIITGDLITDPIPGLFEKFKETLKVFKTQPYLTAGNHDYYFYSEKRKLDPLVHEFREEYKKVFGKSSYSFDSGGYHCIVLDSTGHAADIEVDTDYYCKSTGKTKTQLVDDLNGSGFGLFRKEVLLWLENDLKNVSKTTPVIIFTHHSWGGEEKQWRPGFFKQAVANPHAVGELLKGYNVLANIAGHAHSRNEFSYNGINFYVTSRLAAEGRNTDDSPMAFKVFEIIGREIKTEYVVQPVPKYEPVKGKLPLAQCVKVDQPPIIDGKLDDPQWKSCAPIAPFMLPHGSETSEYPTTAFLTYDRQNLYLAFRCAEPKLEGLVANIKEHDGPLWEDDSLEIFLDTNHDKKTYFHYILNTIGTVYDGKCMDEKWNGPVVVATGREAEFWILEVAIPWKALEITAPTPGTRMGLSLVRNRLQNPCESSQWSPNFTGNHFPERFGILMFK